MVTPEKTPLLGIETLTRQEITTLIDRWIQEDLSGKDPELVRFAGDILRKGTVEIVSEITTVDAVTGYIIDEGHTGPVLQYVKVPNPYDGCACIGPEKFLYSIVTHTIDPVIGDKFICLGIAPIHGPCAEMYRPWKHWMTKASPGVADENTIEEQLWYPISDVLKMSDLVEYVNRYLPDMKDEQSMPLTKCIYFPSYMKNTVELDLFLPLTPRYAAKRFPHLCVPHYVHDADMDFEAKCHPLAGASCGYYHSPCFLPMSFPYSTVVEGVDDDETLLVPPKQSPFLFTGEIEKRIGMMSSLAMFTTRRETNKYLFEAKDTNIRHVNCKNTSLYGIFDSFFAQETPKSATHVRGKETRWVLNSRRRRRQLITGTYEYVVKNEKQQATDSMVHDLLLDGLSYFYYFYLRGGDNAPVGFITYLILYRMSLQTSVWMYGSDSSKPRDIPDISSLARFRMHMMLLNGCSELYFDSYWAMYTTPQRHAQTSPFYRTRTASLEDVFIAKYKGIIDPVIRQQKFNLDTEDHALLIRIFGGGADLEDFMNEDLDSPPPITISLNYDVFIHKHVCVFVSRELKDMSEKFTEMEVSYYEEKFMPGKRPRSETLFTCTDPKLVTMMGKMYEMGRVLAQKMEMKHHFDANKN